MSSLITEPRKEYQSILSEKLVNFQNKLEKFYDQFGAVYSAREIHEMYLMKNIWNQFQTKHISVIGGNTTFDLISTLEGIKCDIDNYDSFVGQYHREQDDIRREIYVIKKYFGFKGNYNLVNKHISSINDLEQSSKTLVINADWFDLIDLVNLTTIPDLVLFSHNRDFFNLDKLLTTDLKQIHRILPLQACTENLLIFSKNTLDYDGIEGNCKKFNFFGVDNVTRVGRFRQHPYSSFRTWTSVQGK